MSENIKEEYPTGRNGREWVDGIRTIPYEDKCTILASSMNHEAIGIEAFYRREGSFVAHRSVAGSLGPRLTGMESIEALRRWDWFDCTESVKAQAPEAYLEGCWYFRFEIPAQEGVVAYQCCAQLGDLDPETLPDLRVEFSGHDSENGRLQIVSPTVEPIEVGYGYVIVAPWQGSPPVVWTWHPGKVMPPGSLRKEPVKLG